MRKHINWLSALLCLSMITFFGCNHDLMNGTVSGDSLKAPGTLTLEITNYNDVIRSNNRTNRSTAITSEQWVTDDTLYFYVWGKATDDEELAPTKVNFKKATDKTGTVDLTSIPSRNWYLTLAVATDDGLQSAADSINNIKNNAVLIGYANVDMHYGSKASFTLTSEGLTKKGTLSIKMYTDGWQASAFETVDKFHSLFLPSVGVYNRVTGEIVNDAAATSATTLLEFKDSTKLSDSSSAKTEYTKELLPGKYVLKVMFTAQSGANAGKQYVLNEAFEIIPGKTSKNDDFKILNIIGEFADAPTGFAVDYKETDANSTYEGYYGAHFTWVKSASKNEQEYVISLAELDQKNKTTITTPTNGTSWDTAVAANATAGYAAATVKDIDAAEYFGGNYYYLGKETSLLASQEEVYLKLELGKRYLARICARNDAGDSEYCYLTIGGTPKTGFTKFNSSTINLFSIKYDLNGGRYYKTGSSTADGAATTVPVYKYHSQSDTANVILYSGDWDATAKKPATTAETIVKRQGPAGSYTYTPWASWKDGSGSQYTSYDNIVMKGSDTAADATDDDPTIWYYTGFENLTFYAIYGNAGGAFTIIDPNDYKINPTWVTYGAKSDSMSAVTNDAGALTKGSALVYLTVPSDNVWNYEKVWFNISKGGATIASSEAVATAKGTPNQISTNLPTGIYTVYIEAKYASVIKSYTFILTVTNE